MLNERKEFTPSRATSTKGSSSPVERDWRSFVVVRAGRGVFFAEDASLVLLAAI